MAIRPKAFFYAMNERMDVLAHLRRNKRGWRLLEKRSRELNVTPEELVAGLWHQWEARREEKRCGLPENQRGDAIT